MELEVVEQLRHGLAIDRAAGTGSGTRLVHACVDTVGVTGAGIMLMVDDEHRGIFGSSDAASELVEDLQFTLGEGPCIDTYRTGRPVLEPDLGHPAEDRWPGFAGPALAAGVVAIFGFPLLVGRIRLGALDLYSDRPGDLRPEQFTDAMTIAEIAAHAILDLQADAAPGALATELDAGVRLRSVVHQASGMVSVQLDIPVGDALARLRAHAYAGGRSLHDVAQDVVDRRLRLDRG
jgi:GAF domain-containing protein